MIEEESGSVPQLIRMAQTHTDPDPEHRFKALEREPAAQGE